MAVFWLSEGWAGLAAVGTAAGGAKGAGTLVLDGTPGGGGTTFDEAEPAFAGGKVADSTEGGGGAVRSASGITGTSLEAGGTALAGVPALVEVVVAGGNSIEGGAGTEAAGGASTAAGAGEVATAGAGAAAGSEEAIAPPSTLPGRGTGVS